MTKSISHAPRYWRKLERHPLGAEYGDIEGVAFDHMVADIKEFGVINKRRVTLYEGKVLDGWQMLRACIAADVKPEFQLLPKGMTAERFVQIVNDNRRHETAAGALRRITARQKRILEAARAGKSTRKIAEEEGISQPTVVRDLADAEANGEVIHDESPETTGRDGKRYSRKKNRTAEEEAPKPGASHWDRKKFDDGYGIVLREIDKLGKCYRAKDTPAAEGLRRTLREWKESFFKWAGELKKGAGEHATETAGT